MLKSANFCLFHFHRAQLYRLLDGNPTNVFDDLLAILKTAMRELFKRFAGGGNRFIDILEDPMATGITGPLNRWNLADFGKDLSHNISNHGFTNLHAIGLPVMFGL